MFTAIIPTAEETALILPGDELIQNPHGIIDSAFDLPASPEIVFPWFLQLGKQRGGWYFTRRVERFIPRSRRGVRHIQPQWLKLAVGQRIPDYGGSKGYFDCFYLKKNEAIGYTSIRGNVTITWVLTFQPVKEHTRVIIRLRMKSTKRGGHPFFESAGKLVDRLTIAGLAAGLSERLQ